MTASFPGVFRRLASGYRRMSISLLPATVIFLALLLSGCSGSGAVSGKRVLRIKGSDTMLLLATRWAEEFMQLHPDAAVYVEGGGSATGIDALIEGDVDLCTASRTLRADEARRLLEKRGSLGISVLTAKDALSVYLHPDNPLHNLTQAQLRGLFTGTITRWDAIGGAPLPVQVISRSPNSGTYLFFEEHILEGRTYAETAVIVPTTPAVIRQVQANPGAIGYGGVAYGAEVIHASVDGVAPTQENVMNGTYPISRYLYLYAAAIPDGLVKEFIDWVLSIAGQQIVHEVGYIPLWDLTKEGLDVLK
ncbi:MAG: phosphate ABC transporter substrate-binding protein [Bacteroidetes bacterium]|nr:phosphate ABC transporter substrate-binding protein [Bacteroidota bacterium]